MPDAELVELIESVMFKDPSRVASPVEIAEQVTEYIEDFVADLDDIKPVGGEITTLPTMLADGTVIEFAITIQKISKPDGTFGFTARTAGGADAASVAGLLELAKYHLIHDDDDD